VVLLFVYVVNAGPLRGKVGSGVIGTPAPASTVPSIPGTTSTIPPTPGPDTSSIYYHFRKAVTASLSTQLDATHNFVPQNITPDGQFLLGYELDSSTQSNPAIARAGYLNVKTRQFTALGLPDGTEMARPSCCQADGRYLLATDNSQPGATCGICHTRVWIYDTVTSQLYKLVEGGQYHGITTVYLSQGHVIFNSGTGIEVADVVSRTIHPLDGSLSSDAHALTFTWPYVIYSLQSSSGALAFYAQDVASGSPPQVISQLQASPANHVNLYLNGTTLYMTSVRQEMSKAYLYSLSPFMSATSKLVQLGSISSQHVPTGFPVSYLPVPWANGKAAVIGSSAWIAGTHQFYPVVPTSLEYALSGTVVSGGYLATFVTLSSHTNTYVGSDVTVYNTALLP
jgi:hypothetical protein